MDILMVAAELGPYARASEAADVVAALSKTLRQLGHDVTLALPRYPGFEAHGLLMARRLTPLSLAGGGEVMLFDGQLASGVRLVLFDAPELYQRPGVFGEEGKNYPDNAARFGLFAQAVVAFVRERQEQGQPFDVVHLHDWPTALIPLVLSRGSGLSVPTVLTVNDFRQQGGLSSRDLGALGIAKEIYADGALKLDGRVSLLKAGLLFADVSVTASRRFVAELRRDEKLGALPRFVEEHGVELVSVPLALDYAHYNPAADPSLPSRYDAEAPDRKGVCKTDLVRKLGLELETSRPLAIVQGALTKESGSDVLAAALPQLLDNDVALVVAGSGSRLLEKKFEKQAQRLPERFAWVPTPDVAMIRRLVAAADMAIVPDRFVPYGSAVLLAARYGAIPVAHAAGCIHELVVDADAQLQTGTGFLFDECTPEALVGAFRRGLSAYRKPAWELLRRRVMRQDLGWDRPARRYVQLYRQAVAAKSE